MGESGENIVSIEILMDTIQTFCGQRNRFGSWMERTIAAFGLYAPSIYDVINGTERPPNASTLDGSGGGSSLAQDGDSCGVTPEAEELHLAPPEEGQTDGSRNTSPLVSRPPTGRAETRVEKAGRLQTNAEAAATALADVEEGEQHGDEEAADADAVDQGAGGTTHKKTGTGSSTSSSAATSATATTAATATATAATTEAPVGFGCSASSKSCGALVFAQEKWDRANRMLYCVLVLRTSGPARSLVVKSNTVWSAKRDGLKVWLALKHKYQSKNNQLDNIRISEVVPFLNSTGTSWGIGEPIWCHYHNSPHHSNADCRAQKEGHQAADRAPAQTHPSGITRGRRRSSGSLLPNSTQLPADAGTSRRRSSPPLSPSVTVDNPTFGNNGLIFAGGGGHSSSAATVHDSYTTLSMVMDSLASAHCVDAHLFPECRSLLLNYEELPPQSVVAAAGNHQLPGLGTGFLPIHVLDTTGNTQCCNVKVTLVLGLGHHSFSIGTAKTRGVHSVFAALDYIDNGIFQVPLQHEDGLFVVNFLLPPTVVLRNKSALEHEQPFGTTGVAIGW